MLTRFRELPGARDRLWSYRRALGQATGRLGRLLRPLGAADLSALAALRADRQPHPWTAKAERIWSPARGSHRRAHHLAVLLHARAYDLEAAGRPEATRYWRAALRWWAEVHRDDDFWRRLQGGLPRRMGVEVDPALVTDVRRRLPTDLLQVHADLVRTYQARAPDRARDHLLTLRSARFDSDPSDGDPVDQHWTALLQPTIEDAREALKADRWEEAIAHLRTWVDPDDIRLIRWQLHTYRRWNEGLRLDDPDDRRQVAANLREAERLVERLDERTVSQAPRELRYELARHHYWQGHHAAQEHQEQLRRLDTVHPGVAEIREIRAAACRASALAVTRFDLARQLDGELATEARYGQIEAEQAYMRYRQAACHLETADNQLRERPRKRELLAAIELLIKVGRADCKLLEEGWRLVSRASMLADRYGLRLDDELRVLRQLLQECRQAAAGRA